MPERFLVKDDSGQQARSNPWSSLISQGASMTEHRFKNRTALVTGGAKGIGAAICKKLASDGAQVAVNYRRSQESAEQLVKSIQNDGGIAYCVQGDMCEIADVELVVSQTESELGPIDLLVNNAGIFDRHTHQELTISDWESTLKINLTGPFLVTWAVKDGMIKREYGRIVNVSSIAGLRARSQCIDYAVSKSGLISFTKSCAEALAEKNIRMNAVAPGLIETEMVTKETSQWRGQLIDQTPIPRIGQPEEIADVVCFLLSEESSFMTGQTVVASGGRVLLP
ncbi:MAG: 3-oxoacyl-ACP reductase family protein [Planctomycetota bacterium]|nr:3-oxoacyl-ACP reductase family protein [Planctomycetota bacterium]